MLSTGLGINSAADDPTGLSNSERIRSQIQGLQSGNQNIQDGISLMNVADGALNEIQAILQRMRELALQASTDTITSTDRSYINTETTQLKNEVDRISSVTNFDKLTLLNGSSPWGTGSGGTIHIGAYNTKESDVVRFKIPTITAQALGIRATTIDSQPNSVAAITAYDVALFSVNMVRSSLGAVSNRLENALTSQGLQSTNLQSTDSIIRDADFATESVTLSRNQIMNQAATAMLAQINMSSSNILSLLK